MRDKPSSSWWWLLPQQPSRAVQQPPPVGPAASSPPAGRSCHHRPVYSLTACRQAWAGERCCCSLCVRGGGGDDKGTRLLLAARRRGAARCWLSGRLTCGERPVSMLGLVGNERGVVVAGGRAASGGGGGAGAGAGARFLLCGGKCGSIGPVNSPLGQPSS